MNDHVGAHTTEMWAARARTTRSRINRRVCLQHMLIEPALLQEGAITSGHRTGMLTLAAVGFDMIEHRILPTLCYTTLGAYKVTGLVTNIRNCTHRTLGYWSATRGYQLFGLGSITCSLGSVILVSRFICPQFTICSNRAFSVFKHRSCSLGWWTPQRPVYVNR